MWLHLDIIARVLKECGNLFAQVCVCICVYLYLCGCACVYVYV